MRVMHHRDVNATKVEAEGAVNVTIQWLISKDHDAPNFAMRRLVIEGKGNTPYHEHPWEHEVFVLEGNGTLAIEGIKYDISEGSFALVPPNVMHNFSSENGMVFLCLVPINK